MPAHVGPRVAFLLEGRCRNQTLAFDLKRLVQHLPGVIGWVRQESV